MTFKSGIHWKVSTYSTSGAFSFHTVNSIEKPPELLAQCDASTVNATVQVRSRLGSFIGAKCASVKAMVGLHTACAQFAVASVKTSVSAVTTGTRARMKFPPSPTWVAMRLVLESARAHGGQQPE